MRKAFLALSALVIAVALVFVPLPLYVISPAPAMPVLDTVRVTGAPDTLSGELLMTTVNVGPATAVRAVGAQFFDPNAELVPLSAIRPGGVNEQEFRQAQTRLFEESVRVAAAVGLRLSGHQVSVSGEGAEVLQVVPGSNADGLLEPGDVIVAVNGEPVRLATDLAVRTARAAPGEKLRLAVRRDDAELNVDIAVGSIPGSSQTGLGVSVMTVHERIALPEGVTVDDVSDIGGSSAGLMLALAVYDLFDPVDLTRGRRIAGTGTVVLSGAVGPIGGIEEKIHAAELAQATIFLAPAEQAAQARDVSPEGIEVVAVTNVQDAIEALRR
ncbi:MAG: PDZ domain-containing protein [Actinomycetota bacterium]|nr:PDZ domain-containing protein [Actinomycetota bacterium]